MNSLFVTVEAYPFKQVGGLGDVSFSLPKELKKQGQDIRVIMPKYKFPKSLKKGMKIIARFNTYIGWKTVDCDLWHKKYDGVDFYFIDSPYYFKRENVYGYGDDLERFAYFSKAVLEAIKYLDGFVPDILHCNDWHSALVMLFLKAFYKDIEPYKDIKTIFTIHNIVYQGVFGKENLWMLGVEEEEYFKDGILKYYEGINIMQAGLYYADKITAVSKTYAEEILEPHYSFGLEKLLLNKKKDLKGIVNGIDYDVFNPKLDPAIYDNYDKESLDLKLLNKVRFQREVGLTEDKDIPILGIVSRLVEQKGIELIEAAMREIIALGIQVVVLGTGYTGYENMFKYYAEKYPKQVFAAIKFDRELSSKIYAASDMFLVPSKCEACGLTQMIAMRYGTIPIVRATGGLKDTVEHFNRYTEEGNGFVFKDYDHIDMLQAIKEANSVYKNKVVWRKLCKNAMERDFTWTSTAKEYLQIYESLKGKS